MPFVPALHLRCIPLFAVFVCMSCPVLGFVLIVASCLLVLKNMAAEWSETPADAPAEAPITFATIENDVPEIKLFGKWSLGDISIKDISLTVRDPFQHELSENRAE